MNKRREQGFTLIELLVVSIIVGILATLVAMTYSGVQAKNRNTKRQANINTVQSELEAFYAEKSVYPTLAQLNDSAWRKENLKTLPDNALRDPQWDPAAKTCINGNVPLFIGAPTAKCYSYQATTADGAMCDDKAPCAQYSLTATLEGGEKYVKTSLN